jgi:hypothetical protein
MNKIEELMMEILAKEALMGELSNKKKEGNTLRCVIVPK